MPMGGDVVFDVDDVPTRHQGCGRIAEGAVMHAGYLGRGRCRRPGEPEDTLDLGGGEWGPGKKVFHLELGRGGTRFRWFDDGDKAIAMSASAIKRSWRSSHDIGQRCPWAPVGFRVRCDGCVGDDLGDRASGPFFEP